MELIFHDELISSQGFHPLLKNPPYNLTLSVYELTTPKKQEKNYVTNNEGDVVIPRPHNAFIIFRNDYAARIKDSPERKISIRLISQMASKQWKQESETVKLFFKLLADMYQHNHRRLYPQYKYSPKYNSARKSKRRRSKAKTDDFKGKEGRIITWYIHDQTDLLTKKTDDAFRYAHLNVYNLDDMKVENSEENSCEQRNYPPATFINYTATPTTPLVLYSTTTTTSSQSVPPPPPPPPPSTHYHHYDVNSENSFLDYIKDDVSGSSSPYYDDNALSPLSFIPVEPMETSSPHSSPPSADECLFWAENNNNDRGVPSSPFGLSLFDHQNIFEIENKYF